MLYVGLDIHDKRIAICVLSEAGQVARRAQVRTLDEMMRILQALPDRFEVCYEASCGYGHDHDLLSPIAARVTVAHPGRLRLRRQPCGELVGQGFSSNVRTVSMPPIWRFVQLWFRQPLATK